VIKYFRRGRREVFVAGVVVIYGDTSRACDALSTPFRRSFDAPLLL